MKITVSLLLLGVLVGCGGGSSGSDLALGEGPCDSSADCAGQVCVALIDGDNPPVYCSQTCGSCPGGYYCDDQTFGLVGLSFCRFGSAATAQTPSEPPRLPCTADSECEDGLVCATYDGERDCTRPCADESACTVDMGMGVTIDVATCAADQTAGVTRTVCLPDPACYPVMTSCITGI